MERFWKYKLDHIIFWIATVSFHMFTRIHLIPKAGLGQFLLEVAVRNILLAIIIYVNLQVLIPRFAQQKKWLLYIVLLGLDFGFYVLMKNMHDIYLYETMGGAFRKGAQDNSFYNLSIAVFYMSFSVALQLSREWYTQREHIRKIEIEKLNTELDYLKAQINPHFLFNSINTIYFQIDKQNVAARETLSSFSEMLRYQLYECNGHEVPAEKEVLYIRNYVDLQRLRKDDNYKIIFEEENINGFTIAPLLLIPFVENAFKHVSHFSQGNEIHISLKKKDDRFLLRIFNTSDGSFLKEKGSHGIGLRNAQRRLELLYPNKHVLKIDSQPKSYEVNLELNII